MPGVLEVNVNLASETATVTYVEGAMKISDLMKAATDAGLPLLNPADRCLAPRSTAPARQAKARDLARKTAFAATLALPVFLLEMGAHLVPGMHEMIGRTIGHQTSWMIQFALTTVVLFWPGRHFYAKGFPALLKGAPDMNSLVAVGTGRSLSLFSYRALCACAAARGVPVPFTSRQRQSSSC